MSKRNNWTQPTNFESETKHLIKGISRYKVTCYCTSCGEHYTVNGRQSIVKRKSTLCKKCNDKKPKSDELKKRISTTLINYYKDPKNRIELGQIMVGKMAGPRHWNWKGGITTQNQIDRNSIEYKNWRNSIFVRDDYTCVICDTRGVDIHAHHVLPWAINETHRYNVDNGITVCETCHSLIHKYIRIHNKININLIG